MSTATGGGTFSRSDLTAEYVRSILHYDPETGVFVWKSRPDIRPSANARREGKVAGCVDPYGYQRIGVDGHRYFGHRLAWLHTHGEWPKGQLDHIDGNRANNRIANLRIATTAQNAANSRAHRDNRSGFKGVSWSKVAKRWIAQISRAGQYRYLGYFDTPEEAHAAYCEAARELHGEFARTA